MSILATTADGRPMQLARIPAQDEKVEGLLVKVRVTHFDHMLLLLPLIHGLSSKWTCQFLHLEDAPGQARFPMMTEADPLSDAEKRLTFPICTG